VTGASLREATSVKREGKTSCVQRQSQLQPCQPDAQSEDVRRERAKRTFQPAGSNHGFERGFTGGAGNLKLGKVGEDRGGSQVKGGKRRGERTSLLSTFGNFIVRKRPKK